jgi:hypothetical protein
VVFEPNVDAAQASQQERVAVPMVLRHLADAPRLDPEFALRLVAATMRVLSVRLAALLSGQTNNDDSDDERTKNNNDDDVNGDNGGADVQARAVALSNALRTLRAAQQQAIDVAADKRASRLTSATDDDRDDAVERDDERELRMLAQQWTPSGTAGAVSIGRRVAAARARRPRRSAWPAVVADVCRAVYDALETGRERHATTLLTRLGASPPRHLAALALAVTRASLRRRLVPIVDASLWCAAERRALRWLELNTGAVGAADDGQFALLYGSLASQRRALRRRDEPFQGDQVE